MKDKTFKVWKIISSVLLGICTTTIVYESLMPAEYSLVVHIREAFKDLINDHPENVPVERIEITENIDRLLVHSSFHVNYKVYPENATNVRCRYEFSDNLHFNNNSSFYVPALKDKLEEDAYVKVISLDNENISSTLNFKIYNTLPDKFDIYAESAETRFINLEDGGDLIGDDIYGPHGKDRLPTKDSKYYTVRPNTEVFYMFINPYDSKNKAFGTYLGLDIKTDERYIKRDGIVYHIIQKPPASDNYITDIVATYNFPKELNREPMKYVIHMDFDWKEDNLTKTIKANTPVDFKITKNVYKEDGDFEYEDETKTILNEHNYEICPIDKDGNFTRVYFETKVKAHNANLNIKLFNGRKFISNYNDTFDFVISSPTGEFEPIEKTFTSDFLYKKPTLIFNTEIEDPTNISLKAGNSLTFNTKVISDDNDELKDSYCKAFNVISSDDEVVKAYKNNGKFILKALKNGTSEITIRPVTKYEGVDVKFNVNVYGYEPIIKDESRFNRLMAKGIGHYCGFLVEGFFMASTLYLFSLSLKKLIYVLPLATSLGVLTELFELIGTTRTCSMTDVCIDILGAVTGLAIFSLIIGTTYLVKYIKKKKIK